MKPEENARYMRFPEYDTVEFELEGFPAPMHWNPGKKTLSWARDPDAPVEDRASWDEYLGKILWLLNEEIGNHVPAVAKLQRALAFDPGIAAGKFRIVEPCFGWMPEGANW